MNNNNICGIYALWWEDSSQVYIGQSTKVLVRYKEHIRALELGRHTNYRVTSNYTLHGYPELIVLDICSKDNLNNLEIYWTEEFDSINSGANIVHAGSVMHGVSGPASKFSKLTILKAFVLLCNSSLYSYEYISNRLHIPKSLLICISLGETHHWLKDDYPSEYEVMLLNSTPRCSKARISAQTEYIKTKKNAVSVISPEGIVYNEIYNISDFCRNQEALSFNYKAASTGIRRLILGQLKHYKGWKLYEQTEQSN